MIAGSFFFIALVFFGLWYFSSPNPLSPFDIGLGVAPATTTAAGATSTPAVVPANSTAPKPVAKAPTAPVTSGTLFCPKFSATSKLGDRDTSSGFVGGIATLQIFLAKTYGLNTSSFVDGVFDADTESYLKRYQREMGIPQTGTLDYAAQQHMQKPCLNGLMANGAEYPLKNFTFTAGGVTESIVIRQGLIETGRTVFNGAFRIELISAGSSAKLRVTGPIVGGLQTQTITLGKGAKVTTDNSPSRLTIEVKSLTSSGATLFISR